MTAGLQVEIVPPPFQFRPLILEDNFFCCLFLSITSQFSLFAASGRPGSIASSKGMFFAPEMHPTFHLLNGSDTDQCSVAKLIELNQSYSAK